MTLDAFYADERGQAVARGDHPVGSFYNRFTTGGSQGYRNAKVTTTGFKRPNPLNDPTIATVLPQTLDQLSPQTPGTPKLFREGAAFWLYAPPALKGAQVEARSGESAVTARVAVFFGVGPEVNLFGLRSFFADTEDLVLVGVSGIERTWKDVPTAWGIGVSAEIIRGLLDQAGLTGVPFQVEVMAGYSTGYRGLNLTIVNQLVDLGHLTRILYLDAFYHHDDHPLPAPSHTYFKKLTLWACDTVFAASTAEVWVVAYTHPGGTPRDSGNEPTGPLAQMLALGGDSVRFLDLEFRRDGLEPVADDLEKVCLARLVQAGVDDYFGFSSLPAAMQLLVGLLPARGSLGVAGEPAFTSFRDWRKDPYVSRALADFPVAAALALVNKHRLLGDWTDSKRFEFRHRTFVQEIGKELLLP